DVLAKLFRNVIVPYTRHIESSIGRKKAPDPVDGAIVQCAIAFVKVRQDLQQGWHNARQLSLRAVFCCDVFHRRNLLAVCLKSSSPRVDCFVAKTALAMTS